MAEKQWELKSITVEESTVTEVWLKKNVQEQKPQVQLMLAQAQVVVVRCGLEASAT